MKILLSAAVFAISALTAHAQVFVASNSDEKVSSFDSVTGATLKANFITGLENPFALKIKDNLLYVENNAPSSTGQYALDGTPINLSFNDTFGGDMSIFGSDFIVRTFSNTFGKYDRSGAVVNQSFIVGLNNPQGIARVGNTLYISNFGTNTVGTYNASTGAVINASFISGLTGPTDLAFFNSTLYVANFASNKIGTYDAGTGAVINASFITGLNDPSAMTIFGGRIYVTNRNLGTVGKYHAITGAAINAAFISGVGQPTGIAVTLDKSKAIDLGVISDTTPDYATPDRTTLVTIASAGEVIWYKFTVPENADLASSRFFDVAARPNIPSTLTGDDTEIGIYDSNGALVASDDDDGTGDYSQLSFSSNLAPRGPLTSAGLSNAAAATGQDGTLAAGTYYLAVAPFNTFFGDDFDAGNIGTTTGTFNLEFRTDIPAPQPLNRAPTIAVTTKTIKPTTKSKLKIAGTATDADGDALKVFVKVGKSGFRSAKVTGSKWSFNAKLEVGKNSVQVYSIDGEGLRSATKKLKVTRKP